MNKLFFRLLSALFLSICLFAGCGKNGFSSPNGSGGNSGDEKIPPQISNPFEDFESIEEACDYAGFGVVVPESIEGYPKRHMQAIKGELVQAFYSASDAKSEASDGSKNSGNVLVRKGKGEDDISGDYNEYKKKWTISVGNREVLLRGDNSENIKVATWTEGGYSYAIDWEDGATKTQFSQVISLVL